MPKGIPGSSGTTKDDLKARIKEIEERIKQMDRREKAFVDLKKWLTSRKLDHYDLHWMVRQMAPARAVRAVTSKKPLRPPVYKRHKGNGTFVMGGVIMQAKGDPEFRRSIREARLEQGMNSVTLGKKVGVSNATITSWEVGRYIPREEYRAKIVKALGLPAGLGAGATAEMEAAAKLNGGRH